MKGSVGSCDPNQFRDRLRRRLALCCALGLALGRGFAFALGGMVYDEVGIRGRRVQGDQVQAFAEMKER